MGLPEKHLATSQMQTDINHLIDHCPVNASDEGLLVDDSGNITLKLGDAAGATKVTITDVNDVEVASIDSDGNAQFDGSVRIDGPLGLGIAPTAYTLDIIAASGSIRLASTADDAAVKTALLANRHYTNAEEDIGFVTSISGVAQTALHLGGGVATLNAATYIDFYTAPDITTLKGTRRMRLASNGRLGLNLDVPLAMLHIDQSSTTAAIPVLILDQADNSEGFVNLIGTSAASAVGPITTWISGTGVAQGMFRIEINGVAQWMPYYNAPTGP